MVRTREADAGLYPRRFVVLVLTNIGLLLLVLLGLEWLVRLTTDIQPRLIERQLFIPDAFGSSYGNRPGIRASAYGRPVYVDQHGFRVGRRHSGGESERDRAILILGDSVGFGLGVDYESTFVARLEADHETLKFYNAAVVGYTTREYLDVVRYFVPQHSEIRRVFIIFCLNDIHDESAGEISASLENERSASRSTFAHALRQRGVVGALKKGLRVSKLYLWVRARRAGHEQRIWMLDRQRYEEDRGKSFDTSMRHLQSLVDLLREAEIGLTVVVMPYENQLGSPGAPDRHPQERLLAEFDRMGIEAVDALGVFEGAGVDPADLFLPHDSVHLSARGHEVLFELLRDDLARSGFRS